MAGAGFAGLTALGEFARLRRRHRFPAALDVRVTLVDRNAYSAFQPLLYQVATAGLTAADVAYPAWTAVRRAGAHFRKGEITSLDIDRRQLLLRDGSVVGYDYLILATGVSAAFFGVTGAAEHALSMYTRRDAIILRDHLMNELERRSAEGDTRDLNITVVGGGATGVELAGTLAELRNIAVPASFPDLDPARIHVRLIELGPALIAPFAEPLREYARAELLERGVEVRLGTEIAEVAMDHVRIATRMPGTGGDETRIRRRGAASDVTVWAAGVVAPEWIKQARAADRPRRADSPETGPDRGGPGRVFAAGDIAVIDGDPARSSLSQQSSLVNMPAAQIAGLASGLPTQPFSYKNKGHDGDHRASLGGR